MFPHNFKYIVDMTYLVHGFRMTAAELILGGKILHNRSVASS